MSILLTPARIGPVEIPNRIVMPSMTTRTADAEGVVTDASLAYYAARARGGTGLITVEMASPERAGRHRRRELGIYDDRFLPPLEHRRIKEHLLTQAMGIKAGISELKDIDRPVLDLTADVGVQAGIAGRENL